MFNFIKVYKAKSKLRCGLNNQNAGNFDKALECFDEVLDILPDCKYVFGFKGLVYEDLNEFDCAFKCYDKAIEMYPERAQSWNSKATLLSKLDKYNEALECLNKGIELNKNNNDIIINILLGKSQVFINYNGYDKVLEVSNEILRINNNDAKGIHLKGAAFELLNDLKNSFKWYSKLTDLYPRNEHGWYGLATICAKMGKLEDACLYIEKSIKIDPNNSYDYFLYSNYLYKLGYYKKGLKMINKAFKLDQNPSYYYLKGKILEKMDKDEKAIENYEIGLKKSIESLKIESNPINNYIIGSFFTRLNQHSKAIESYETVLKLDPDCKRARKNIEKLKDS